MEIGNAIDDKVFDVVNYSIGAHIHKCLVDYDSKYVVRHITEFALRSPVNDSINSILVLITPNPSSRG